MFRKEEIKGKKQKRQCKRPLHQQILYRSFLSECGDGKNEQHGGEICNVSSFKQL